MKHIVVFGGSGYIGTEVCSAFSQLEEPTLNVDIAEPEGLIVPYMHADIRMIDELTPMAECPFQAIVMLAAVKEVTACESDPILAWDVNLTGLIRAVRACSPYRPHIVFASSAAVYGNASGVVDESHPTNPTSVYGITKLAGERFVRHVAESTGAPATILRIFNVHGYNELWQGPAASSLPARIEHAAHNEEPLTINGGDWDTPDGTPVRDYIHVSEVARAIVNASDRTNGELCEVINIGSGTGTSAAELCEQNNVRYLIGPRRPGDIGMSIADVSKAQTLLSL